MRARVLYGIVPSVTLSPGIARACSVCLAGDDDAVTHAFNWSVGFLLAAPYAIVGTIAICLVIAYRRAAARRAVLDEGQVAGRLIWSEEESAK